MSTSQIETHHGVGLVLVDKVSRRAWMPPTIPEDAIAGKHEAVFSVAHGFSFDAEAILDTAQAVIAGSVGESKLGMIGGKRDRLSDGKMEELPKALAREWCEEISELLVAGQFQSFDAENQANILSFITRVCEKIEQTDPQSFVSLPDLRVVQWREIPQADGIPTREIRGMLTVSVLLLMLDEVAQEKEHLQQLGFTEVQEESLRFVRPYAQVVIRELGLV